MDIQLPDKCVKAAVDIAAMGTLVNTSLFEDIFGYRQSTTNCT